MMPTHIIVIMGLLILYCIFLIFGRNSNKTYLKFISEMGDSEIKKVITDFENIENRKRKMTLKEYEMIVPILTKHLDMIVAMEDIGARKSKAIIAIALAKYKHEYVDEAK